MKMEKYGELFLREIAAFAGREQTGSAPED